MKGVNAKKGVGKGWERDPASNEGGERRREKEREGKGGGLGEVVW